MSGTFNALKQKMLQGHVNLEGDTIRMLLVKPSYEVNHNPDLVFVADLPPATFEVVNIVGYARPTLAGVAVVKNNALDRSEVTFDDIVFTNISVGAIGGCIFYKFVTDDAASILLWYATFVKSTNGGKMTIKSQDVGALQAFDYAA